MMVTPQRWRRLAKFHDRAAQLCRKLANQLDEGHSTRRTYTTLRRLESRGGHYACALVLEWEAQTREDGAS